MNSKSKIESHRSRLKQSRTDLETLRLAVEHDIKDNDSERRALEKILSEIEEGSPSSEG